MSEKTEFGLLVSNIVEKNDYSHCRLCLEFIREDQFAKFEHTVFCSADEEVSLSYVLSKIFGDEICHEIPGVNALCKVCLQRTVKTFAFINQCEMSTLKLHTVIDNLNSTLTVDIDAKQNHLYILCSEEGESQLVLVENLEVENSALSKLTHKCKNCKENFHNIEELVAHNKNVHELFTCEKCTYTSNIEEDVNKHDESLELYRCEKCHQMRCTEISLKEHQDRTHGLHVCKECGKAFRGLDKLLAHEKKHVVKNECPKCGKNYTTKEYFEKHVKLCLEDAVDPHPMRSRMDKKHFCKTCGKRYSTPGGLRVHERFAHGNAEHHVCDICGKKFTAPCYVKAHMITHTKQKNFPCDLCTGKFVTKEALIYHRRRHTGEKPYQCDECGERFVNASARVDHIKFKHVGPTLSCEHCSRKFVTKHILRIHMKKHHNPQNKLYVGRADAPPHACSILKPRPTEQMM